MSDCIIWTGPVNNHGYGLTRVNGRRCTVHRSAYEAAHGPLPPGIHLHHRCGTPRCMNVDHLEPLTPAEHGRRHAADPDRPVANGYKRGCRCESCVAEKATQRRYDRDKKFAPPPTTHGNYGYSTHGCRCDVCRAANTASKRLYELRRRIDKKREEAA